MPGVIYKFYLDPENERSLIERLVTMEIIDINPILKTLQPIEIIQPNVVNNHRLYIDETISFNLYIDIDEPTYRRYNELLLGHKATPIMNYFIIGLINSLNTIYTPINPAHEEIINILDRRKREEQIIKDEISQRRREYYDAKEAEQRRQQEEYDRKHPTKAKIKRIGTFLKNLMDN
jgi:hypothetical protein